MPILWNNPHRLDVFDICLVQHILGDQMTSPEVNKVIPSENCLGNKVKIDRVAMLVELPF